jgi:hypothetical protein
MEGAIQTGGGAEPRGGLRPLGIGETLDAAIKLYTKNAVKLWALVASVIVPIAVVSIIVRRLALPSDVFVFQGQLYTTTTSGTNGAGGLAGLIVIVVLGFLGQLLVTGAVVKLQLDAYLGHAPSLGEAFEFAGRRIFSLIWFAILLTVMLVIGFFLLFIPFFWLIVSSCVAIPALMLEGLGGFGALNRSIELVGGRWFATFFRLLVALLMYGVLLFVVGLIVVALTKGVSIHNVTAFLIVDQTLRTIGSILLLPFVAAVVNVIYVDLRVRKEGLDIEMLASNLGSPVPATPGLGSAAAPATAGLGSTAAPEITGDPPSSGSSGLPAG